jgi:hypothetical protein
MSMKPLSLIIPEKKGYESDMGLLHKFIQEHGRRAPSSSPAMFAVRSQARKYAALERHRREQWFQGRIKDHLRSVQMVPNPAFVEPLVTGSNSESSSLGTDEGDEMAAGLPTNIDTRQEISESRSHLPGTEGLDDGDSTTCLVATSHSDGNTTLISSKLRAERRENQYRNLVSVNLSRARNIRHSQSQHWQRISPQTILGAGRVDPFQSYPIYAQPYMHNLIDHCKSLHFTVLFLGAPPLTLAIGCGLYNMQEKRRSMVNSE